MSVLNDLLKEPAINAVLISTIVAALLYVQSVFRERTRKRETESARDKIAVATADKVVEKIASEEGRDKLIDETASKVVEKLRISQSTIIPMPPKEERVTVPENEKKP